MSECANRVTCNNWVANFFYQDFPLPGNLRNIKSSRLICCLNKLGKIGISSEFYRLVTGFHSSIVDNLYIFSEHIRIL